MKGGGTKREMSARNLLSLIKGGEKNININKNKLSTRRARG